MFVLYPNQMDTVSLFQSEERDDLYMLRKYFSLFGSVPLLVVVMVMPATCIRV